MRKTLFTFFVFFAAVLVFSIVIGLLIINRSKGALQVTSNHKADVYLNDRLIGATPFCKCDLKNMIPQGEYTIKMVPQDKNYEEFEQKINIEPKALTAVDKIFAEKGLDSASTISLSSISDKKKAQISILTFPQGAQVFIDNNLVGQTPITLNKNSASDYELRFSQDGYKDKIVRVHTELGFKLNVVIYLGLDKENITLSSDLSISSVSAVLKTQKIKILDTPTGFLRVREQASVSSKEISQVLPEEEFLLIEEVDGWYKIKLSDKKEGWISSQYASKN